MDKILVSRETRLTFGMAALAGWFAHKSTDPMTADRADYVWEETDIFLASGGYAVAPEQDDDEVAALRKRLVENHDYICERDDDVRDLTAEVARLRGVVERFIVWDGANLNQHRENIIDILNDARSILAGTAPSPTSQDDSEVTRLRGVVEDLVPLARIAISYNIAPAGSAKLVDRVCDILAGKREVNHG